ncbi:MAG: orotidine-5'-phosphate decarboxylase [Deltaproteobacteria bacterium]|nr:orotidine-5'-phosphate decarboxylase [Deltaproteobacteria bacterium]
MIQTPELIVALDFPNQREALDLASRLRGVVNWVKVGLELFLVGGQPLVEELKEAGFQVFLDLKFMDIPNTVQAAVSRATAMGADMLTIHTLGGRAMAEAALVGREAAMTAGQAAPRVLGVTILTSMGPADLVWNPHGSDEDLQAQTVELAMAAQNWGLDGVVCSGREVRAIRRRCEASFNLLTPGIRLPGANAGDQTRVCTPAQAVRDGSTFLVVGRPITRASDPVDAAKTYHAEIAQPF